MKNTIKTLILTILSLTLTIQATEENGNIITSDGYVLSQITEEHTHVFHYSDTMEPLLGYVNAHEKGRRGVLQTFDASLQEDKDVHLTINFRLQKKLETLLDKQKEAVDADEVMAMVMESETGNMIAMATSKRYNPNSISQKDIYAMVTKFTKYPYEPGATMKPLVLAMALEKRRIDISTVFNIYGGQIKLEDAGIIRDNMKEDVLSAEEIIVHSSNVGIVQVSRLLTGVEFREGLENFGFMQFSGLDLQGEKRGYINPVTKFEKPKYRAYASIGYGLVTTPIQLLKAYNIFNNDGKAIIPHVHQEKRHQKGEQTVTKVTAQALHKILVKNVTQGYARDAQYGSYELGAQTSTAYIYKKGKYRREFHSSIYGFANDKQGHKYTIGVLTIQPKAKDMYFASRSAVPVFRKIVSVMEEMGFLVEKL
jgi:cell division protein FtsI (penicillin-binding protein 3)